MYSNSNSNSNPSIAIFVIVLGAFAVLASLIRLCQKCEGADDRRQSSNPMSVVPVQQLPMSAPPGSRPWTNPPVTRPPPAAQPLSYPRSTAITIDLTPAPVYEPYPTYPPMPVTSSSYSPSSLSPAPAYPPLVATSLSPAVASLPISQPQLPSYPQMAQTLSNTTNSSPPAYSASATSWELGESASSSNHPIWYSSFVN